MYVCFSISIYHSASLTFIPGIVFYPRPVWPDHTYCKYRYRYTYIYIYTYMYVCISIYLSLCFCYILTWRRLRLLLNGVGPYIL